MIERLVGVSRRLLILCLALVVGCSSVLFAVDRAEAQQMVASWYCEGFEGLTTASGEVYDCDAYTAAHKTLPFGTKLIVTYNDRSVVVRINDRGPYIAGRDLDLSGAAAEYIGLTSVGVATVDVQYADPSTPEGPYSAEPPAPEPAPEPEPTAEPVRQAPAEEPQEEAQAPAEAQYAEEPAAQEQYAEESAAEEQYAEEPAAQEQYAEEPAAQEQETAARGQYDGEPAAQEQYAEEQVAESAAQQQYQEPEPQVQPPPAPAPSGVEVPPPAPDTGSLQEPPEDLIQPGTTVEKRVVLLLAAPPEGFENLPDPAQAREQLSAPTPEPEVEPSSGQAQAPASSSEQVFAPAPEQGDTTKQAEPSSGQTQGSSPEQSSGEDDGALITVLPDTGGAPLSALVCGGLLLCSGFLIRRVLR